MKSKEDENMTAVKKILAIALALMLAISLAACGGSNSGGNSGEPGAGGNNATNPPASTPPSVDKHNCPCDPECTNKECKGGDKCKCGTDDAPPLTYDIAIKAEWDCAECSFEDCRGVTSGAAKVTMNVIDSKIGYLGSSADGSGEDIAQARHAGVPPKTMLYADPLQKYEFNAQLSIHNQSNGKIIRVGIDRFGPDKDILPLPDGPTPVPGSMYAMYLGFSEQVFSQSDKGSYEFDPDTGMVIFDLPLTDGGMQGTFIFDITDFDFFVGLGTLTITITLTPVD
jgi:hypothetical protein